METLIIENLHFVGATGFEPATTWSQTRRATGLRYTPFDVNLHMSGPQQKGSFLICVCKGSNIFRHVQVNAQIFF